MSERTALTQARDWIAAHWQGCGHAYEREDCDQCQAFGLLRRLNAEILSHSRDTALAQEDGPPCAVWPDCETPCSPECAEAAQEDGLRAMLERMVDHFATSVAAVPNQYGGRLVAEAHALLADTPREQTCDGEGWVAPPFIPGHKCPGCPACKPVEGSTE